MACARSHAERDDRAGATGLGAATATGLRSSRGGGGGAGGAVGSAPCSLPRAARRQQAGWSPASRADWASATHPRPRRGAAQRLVDRRCTDHRSDPHGLRKSVAGRGVVSGGCGDLCSAPLVGSPRPYGRASAGRPRIWSTSLRVRRRLRRRSRCFFTCRDMSSASSCTECVISGEHSRARSVTPFR